MKKDILKIYDNFLAKFQFFRNFIKVLLRMDEEVEGAYELIGKQGTSINKTNEEVLNLEKEFEELKEKFNDLSDKYSLLDPDAPKSNTMNFNRKPAEIVQAQYDAYNNK